MAALGFVLIWETPNLLRILLPLYQHKRQRQQVYPVTCNRINGLLMWLLICGSQEVASLCKVAALCKSVYLVSVTSSNKPVVTGPFVLVTVHSIHKRKEFHPNEQNQHPPSPR